MDKTEQNFLLKLARKSIEYYFDHTSQLKILDSDLPSKELVEKRACFVTLKKDGQLRGCVGHLEPMQPLYKDVIENSIAAAFFDSRFWPLTKEEFDKIKIEISILSQPKRLPYQKSIDLKKLLQKTKPGVIIQKKTNDILPAYGVKPRGGNATLRGRVGTPFPSERADDVPLPASSRKGTLSQRDFTSSPMEGRGIRRRVNNATFLPQVWEELKTAEEFLSNLCLKAGLSPSAWQEERLEVFTYTVEAFTEA